MAEVVNTYENAHAVVKGDPACNGPYLDDIRAQEEKEYRARREAELNAVSDDSAETFDEKEEEESKEKTSPKVKAKKNA